MASAKVAPKQLVLSILAGIFVFSNVPPLKAFSPVKTFQEISSGPLLLHVDSDGGYHIDIDGVTWLESQNTFVTIDSTIYSKYHDTLRVVSGPKMTLGTSQKFGKYQQIDLIWEARNKQITSLSTTFQVYLDTSTIVFSMNFSDYELRGTSQGNENVVCTSFPSFKVADKMRDDLAFMSFGFFLAIQNIGRWNSPLKLIGSGMDSAPLTLFNRTKHSIMMSTFNEFTVNSMVHDPIGDILMFGVEGKIKKIPKGFVHQSILHFGAGIKETALRWGDMMRQHYETNRYIEKDLTLNYIGYWTDGVSIPRENDGTRQKDNSGGAFYYYNTVPNKTYEQTMLDIKADADRNHIPYKYYQIDSWWYYRGIAGNVKNWTAMPSIFPHGAGYVYQHLGHRLAAHNRCWAADTDYAKQNGGKWDFIIEKEKAIPQDKEFWNFLMSSSKNEWGLTMYEQDWMANENSMDCTLENITVARLWMLGMGYGAMMNNITLQYCQPMPRHLLQSLEIPHLTQARASIDYHPGEIPQWDIGLISIIFQALDIRPFKDNFRTVSANEHHPKYKQSEPYPFLQCVVALFSMGPVAPSDKIGFTNVTLLNRTMNSDGLLLQPSRPMLTVDDYILRLGFEEDNLGFNGKVWTTYSNVSGFYFGSILAIQMAESVALTPKQLDLEMIGPSVAYLDEQVEKTITTFDANHPLILAENDAGDIKLWQTAPTFTFKNLTWAILGETNKLVPFSPKRFEVFDISNDLIRLQVSMGPQETVMLDVYTGMKLWRLECSRDQAGPMLIEIHDINSYNCLIPPSRF